jgi:hypothetical protein
MTKLIVIGARGYECALAFVALIHGTNQSIMLAVPSIRRKPKPKKG